MELLHLIILGLVQGLTEFLPISSSAHLILLPEMAGWHDQGLVYDIAAHLGSLCAVIFYFNKELKRITVAGLTSISTGKQNSDSLLFWYLIIATLPIALVAFFTYSLIATVLRDPIVIAVATIFFGLILWWADVYGKRIRTFESVGVKDACIIGLFQILAMVPGTSRSGITMTAGLMLGLQRTDAARFSFLLAIPTILLAGCHEIYRFIKLDGDTDPLGFLVILVVSAISAWCAIKLFLNFLERTGMLPFVIYRLGLGLLLFYLYG